MSAQGFVMAIQASGSARCRGRRLDRRRVCLSCGTRLDRWEATREEQGEQADKGEEGECRAKTGDASLGVLVDDGVGGVARDICFFERRLEVLVGHEGHACCELALR